MVNKIYVSANDYLRDGWRLARQVMDSGWRPDVLIALWRGGAPVGVAVHEFLHYHGFRPRHHVLKCQSYTGIQARGHSVEIENAEQVFGTLEPGARVLVVDDVLDTGNTARAILDRLAPHRVDARLATVYWKPSQTKTGLKPDYHVCETEDWIVFPHEMDGLTPDELKLKDPVLYGLLAPAAPR